MSGKQIVSLVTTGLFLVGAVVLYLTGHEEAAAALLPGALAAGAIPRVKESQ